MTEPMRRHRGGIQAVPASAGRPGPRSALHSFSRSLRAQLRDTTVEVFDVPPALVDTHLAKPLPGAKLAPEVVAHAVLDAVAADRYELNVGQARLVAWLSRLAPAFADRAVQRALRARRRHRQRSQDRGDRAVAIPL